MLTWPFGSTIPCDSYMGSVIGDKPSPVLKDYVSHPSLHNHDTMYACIYYIYV